MAVLPSGDRADVGSRPPGVPRHDGARGFLRRPHDGLRQVIVIAAVSTCAGLILLAQADRLTALGHRISALEAQRQQLLEERAEALIALSAAGDPRARAERAAAMGFTAPEISEQLPVLGPLARPLPPEAPLALVHGTGAESAPSSRWTRLLTPVGRRIAGVGARGAAAREVR